MGGPHDLRLNLSDYTEGESLQKCEKISDLGIIMNSAFNPSANVLTAANKANGMLYFMKRSFFKSDEGDLRTSIQPHLEVTINAVTAN